MSVGSFADQLYDIEPALAQQALLVVTKILTSKGAAARGVAFAQADIREQLDDLEKFSARVHDHFRWIMRSLCLPSPTKKLLAWSEVSACGYRQSSPCHPPSGSQTLPCRPPSIARAAA